MSRMNVFQFLSEKYFVFNPLILNLYLVLGCIEIVVTLSRVFVLTIYKIYKYQPNENKYFIVSDLVFGRIKLLLKYNYKLTKLLIYL